MASMAASRSPPRKRSKKPTPRHRKRSATDYDKLVGNNVRVHRLSKGLTQLDLADALGISFQQVQKYEKGLNRLHVQKLAQIGELFGVSVHALMDQSATDGDGSAVPIIDRQSYLFMESFQRLAPAVRSCLAHLVEELKPK